METGTIVNGFFVQGDVKFAVDLGDSAHKAFDAVAALSQPDKVKLAKLNGIQAEPYNKQLLTSILKSVVQNAWFTAKVGTIPAEVLAGHNARLVRYNAEIQVPTSNVDFLSKKTRAASSQAKTLLFTIDEAKYEAEYTKWRGQAALVVRSLVELGGKSDGKSIRDIFENVKETHETAAPSRNAVGQIINKLVAVGIATCLNPQDAKKKPEPKTTPAPVAPVAKKVTPPAAPAKKKH